MAIYEMLDTLAFNPASVKSEAKLAIGGRRLIESKLGLIDLIPDLEGVPGFSEVKLFSAGKKPDSPDDVVSWYESRKLKPVHPCILAEVAGQYFEHARKLVPIPVISTHIFVEGPDEGPIFLNYGQGSSGGCFSTHSRDLVRHFGKEANFAGIPA